MSRAPGRRCRSTTALALVAVMGGCTAEFIVGASGGSSSGDDGPGPTTGGGDDGSVSADASDDDTSANETTTSASATSPIEDSGSAETTDGVEASAESPETGVETSMPETGDPTEGGSVEEAGTTGEPIGTPCAEAMGADGCEEDWHCDWFGEGDLGNCWHDPCVDGAETTCEGLDYVVCSDAPLCMWIGEPEDGECTYPDCSALDVGPCEEAPACDWNGEMCTALECAPCFEFGMADCVRSEACQWVETVEPATCSSA